MILSNKTLGDGQTLILPVPEGGTYIISQLNVLAFTLNCCSPREVTTFGDNVVREYHSLQEISGTLDFQGRGCEYYDGELSQEEAVIEGYSVSDMLRIVTQKIRER